MGLINLTRGDIITDALDVAGRPDLISSARLWLNLYLEQVYYNQDMYWTQKTVNVAVSEGVAMPSDYRASRVATMVDGSSRLAAEIISDPARWQDIKTGVSTTTTSIPNYVFADELNRVFNFLPAPKSGIVMELAYFSVPSLPDHTSAATDSETPVWKLPAQVLIDRIKVKAMEYNDDDRFDKAEAKQEKNFMEAKMNDHDRRGGPSRLQMGRRFRKRF